MVLMHVQYYENKERMPGPWMTCKHAHYQLTKQLCDSAAPCWSPQQPPTWQYSEIRLQQFVVYVLCTNTAFNNTNISGSGSSSGGGGGSNKAVALCSFHTVVVGLSKPFFSP